jgi:dTDP-4-dehydrorhamnose reductase
MANKKVLVIGASGMLGNAVFRYLSARSDLDVVGSLRSASALRYLPTDLHTNLRTDIDALNSDDLVSLFAAEQPEIVINSVGLVKQLAAADDPLSALPINAILPHRLARLAATTKSRLIHISTDCVFDGEAGNYDEDDFANARDLYGRSKLLGEVDYPHAITLRTSIIGHELSSSHGLVDWFLSQSGSVRGFAKAVFSGLPTVELARVIADFVIPNPQLHGLYHVSASAINKMDLLTLLGQIYGRATEIVPDEKLVIDRSLNSRRFQTITGYSPPPWRELVTMMRDFDAPVQTADKKLLKD